MMYKILHYISKYNLMLLTYALLLYVVLNIVRNSYLAFIITTLTYIILIKTKILVFSSTWIEK